MSRDRETIIQRAIDELMDRERTIHMLVAEVARLRVRVWELENENAPGEGPRAFLSAAGYRLPGVQLSPGGYHATRPEEGSSNHG